jgi:predicted PurR-regulated permease PerM
VESQFATPRIMGGSVHLSPMVVFLGVIIGLQVYGILGALVAVPGILVIREVFRYVHAKLLDEDPFPEPAEPQAFAAPAVPDDVGDLPDTAEDGPGG